jgi:hypothetical protein
MFALQSDLRHAPESDERRKSESRSCGGPFRALIESPYRKESSK